MKPSSRSGRTGTVGNLLRATAWSLFAFGCANDVVLGEHVGTTTDTTETQTTGTTATSTMETRETPESTDDRSSLHRFDGGRPPKGDDRHDDDGPWGIDGGFDARFPDDPTFPPFSSDPRPIIDPDPVAPRPIDSTDRPPEPPLGDTSDNFGSEAVSSTESTSE